MGRVSALRVYQERRPQGVCSVEICRPTIVSGRLRFRGVAATLMTRAPLCGAAPQIVRDDCLTIALLFKSRGDTGRGAVLLRYLVELAWVPDAFNTELRWREDGPDTLAFSAGGWRDSKHAESLCVVEPLLPALSDV